MSAPRIALAALCLVTASACGRDGRSGAAPVPSSATTEVVQRAVPTSTSSSTTIVATTGTIAAGTTSTTAPAETVRPSVTTTRPPVAPPVTAPPVMQPFSASITTVTADDLDASWRPGCPVPVDQLRAIDATHLGNDGAVHTGRLIVAADLAQGMVDALADLYAARFPIARMQPIDVYGGDDLRSISANNTSAFNCRLTTGGTTWSEHAYGRAVDINPLVNPYVKGSTVLPPEAAPYANRRRTDPGMIHAGDAVVEALAARGWRWGGYWGSLKDYQHFSTSGR